MTRCTCPGPGEWHNTGCPVGDAPLTKVKPSSHLVGKRRSAAEEVCWTLVLMMDLGGLEIEPEWRDYLAGPMGAWTALAVETGVMNS